MALGKNDHERATRGKPALVPSGAVRVRRRVPRGPLRHPDDGLDRTARPRYSHEVYSTRVQVWVLQRMNTQPVTFKVPESVSSNSER